jgi:hypothetical protein
MQHKGSEFLTVQGFDALLVLSGAQGQDAQDLRFTPRKKRAAVGSGQQAHFTGYRPDFVEFAVINSALLK